MEEKYAYLTIQRYVLLLIHSYDFLIPEFINNNGDSPEKIPQRKVIN